MFNKVLYDLESVICNQTETKRGWKIAKPLSGPFIVEFKNRMYGAIQVLLGKSFPIRWY